MRDEIRVSAGFAERRELDMAHSLSDFLAETADRPQNTGVFEVENDRSLQVNMGSAGSGGAPLGRGCWSRGSGTS
jgi:hypothetical protein